jgi:sugar phosphate isomerase/epimerase
MLRTSNPNPGRLWRAAFTPLQRGLATSASKRPEVRAPGRFAFHASGEAVVPVAQDSGNRNQVVRFCFFHRPVKLSFADEMKNLCCRREFLKTASRRALALAGLGLVGRSSSVAVEPFQRAGAPRLRLSLAAYSFRQFFSSNNKKNARPKAGDRQLTMDGFVDYCADHGCDGAELTSYYFPEGFDTEYLLKLKRHAFLRGIAISGSAVGNNFALPKGPERDAQIAHVKKWVDYCAVLGAPHIRVFAGPTPDKDKAAAKQRCIEALEESGEYAGRKGIFLGLENHGGIVTEPQDLLEIVQAVKNPWVGINLDTGNFHTDDPYADLAKCAPYAVNVQFKSQILRRGQKQKETADLARVVKLLRDANYQGYFTLEYEAPEDPWQAVPELLKKMKAALAA